MPRDTPDTIPLDEPTLAMPVLLLLQTPPPGSVKAVVDPMHTRNVPVMGEGADITVTVDVATQPDGKV